MTTPIDCFYAKNHVLIWSNGYMSPCCNYKDKEDPIGDYTDVFQFFNSVEMVKLREDHANGIKRPGCRKCWEVEASGGISYRKPSRPEDKDKIKGLDIAFSRVCTLKCRTCGPGASSAWESELISRGIKKPRKNILDISSIPPEAFTDVEQLDIQGGEPFISKKLPETLQYLSTSGLSKNISLTITTNADCFPDNTYTEPLAHFKSVLIKLSVDAVGVRNEYIRSGSNWQRTINTIEQWGMLKKQMPNMKLVVNHTVSTFNFIYYNEIVEEIKRIRLLPGLDDLNLWCHHALENEWHNCLLLPQSIRDEVKLIWAQGDPEPFEIPNFRSVMVELLSHSRPLPPMSFNSWIENNTVMDTIRQQSIDTALPELIDLFKRHGLYNK